MRAATTPIGAWHPAFRVTWPSRSIPSNWCASWRVWPDSRRYEGEMRRGALRGMAQSVVDDGKQVEGRARFLQIARCAKLEGAAPGVGIRGEEDDGDIAPLGLGL